MDTRQRSALRIAALTATAVLMLLSSGCGELLNLTAPGEIGDVINYGVRIMVVDDKTEREIVDVRILVKDGPQGVVANLTTDEFGRASFIKQYHVRRPKHYGRSVGYPDNFLIVCEAEGYKTLHQTVPGNNFVVDSAKGSARHLIRLQAGRGIVRQKVE